MFGLYLPGLFLLVHDRISNKLSFTDAYVFLGLD